MVLTVRAFENRRTDQDDTKANTSDPPMIPTATVPVLPSPTPSSLVLPRIVPSLAPTGAATATVPVATPSVNITNEEVKSTPSTTVVAAIPSYLSATPNPQSLIFDLKSEVKAFLMAGQILKHYSATDGPQSRHVHVSPEFTRLICKHPSESGSTTNTMSINSICSIERGRATPSLQIKTLFGRFVAKDECSLAIIGDEWSLDLEMKDTRDREKWVSCLLQLINYQTAMKKSMNVPPSSTTTPVPTKVPSSTATITTTVLH
jgi:hypothetical protein